LLIFHLALRKSLIFTIFSDISHVFLQIGIVASAAGHLPTQQKCVVRLA
jgi:hypothetical protein